WRRKSTWPLSSSVSQPRSTRRSARATSLRAAHAEQASANRPASSKSACNARTPKRRFSSAAMTDSQGPGRRSCSVTWCGTTEPLLLSLGEKFFQQRERLRRFGAGSHASEGRASSRPRWRLHRGAGSTYEQATQVQSRRGWLLPTEEGVAQQQ